MGISSKLPLYVVTAASALAVVCCGRSVDAGTYGLGVATDYNVFVFKDDTQSGSDVQGRVAVGRDALFGGYTIASGMSLQETAPTLVVGRNYSNSSHTVRGPVVIGGNANINNPTIFGNVAVNGNLTLTSSGTINGNTLSYGGILTNPSVTLNVTTIKPSTTTTLPIDFAAAQADLIARSAYLGSLAANGQTVAQYGGITFTSTGVNPLQVFSVSGATLAASGYMNINAQAGQTVVINVDGSASSMKGGLNLNGVDAAHVLFNFTQAESLSLSSIGVKGSILAPYANVNFTNGSFDGTLVANSVTGSGEFHNVRFEGVVPYVVGAPEPGSFAIFAIAGILSFLGARLRRTE